MIHPKNTKNSGQIISFFLNFKLPIWVASLSVYKLLWQVPQKRKLEKLEEKLQQLSHPWRLSIPNCKSVVAGRRGMRDGGTSHYNDERDWDGPVLGRMGLEGNQIRKNTRVPSKRMAEPVQGQGGEPTGLRDKGLVLPWLEKDANASIISVNARGNVGEGSTLTQVSPF